MVMGRAAFGGWAIAIFLILQVSDGVLTYIGVQRHGLHVEGNPLLRTLIMVFGEVPALVSAKFLAVICGGILYLTKSHLTITVLNVLYLLIVILPWYTILFRS